MTNIKTKLKTSVLSLLLLATAFTAPLAAQSASAEESASANGSSAATYDVGKKYYQQDYENLNDVPVEDIVYESLTYEKATYLFQQSGNYLILLGGSWCGNTKAIIDYVNDAANEAGVDTVYNLDFRLDGTNGDTHIRETNTSTKNGAKYNYLYGELVTKYLTNLNDWVEYTRYTDEGVDNTSALTYTNADGVDVTVPKVQVPFLFIYNKDNTVDNSGRTADNDNYRTTYPIVYGYEKMFNRNEDNSLYTGYGTNRETYTPEQYKAELNEKIFSHIGSDEGKIQLDTFTDEEYIRLSYNEKAGQTVFKASTAKNPNPINIRTLTYKQLTWLLEQEGNYLILFGGSWCGNTQAVVKIINDYAVENDLIVYNFDTKLDGGYAKKYWGYAKDVHIRDSSNEFVGLYTKLVDKENGYLKNIETQYDVNSENASQYITGTDGEKYNKLQVPYFFAYNKDIVDNDAHPTPILGYVEKMYTLSNINDAANYADYTSAAFAVLESYATKAGITAKDIVTTSNATGDGTNNGTNNDTNNDPAEDPKPEEDDNNGTVVKIVIAVVAVLVIAGVVLFVVLKKKNSSGGGKCC